MRNVQIKQEFLCRTYKPNFPNTQIASSWNIVVSVLLFILFLLRIYYLSIDSTGLHENVTYSFASSPYVEKFTSKTSHL
jgi:hypothetical protein